MTYSREEYDWIEAEWAFHLHGRSAFLSADDFQKIKEWEGQLVPADLIVSAIKRYFERRSKKERPKSFIALSHIQPDIDKILKLRTALDRHESSDQIKEWNLVKSPLREDPKAQSLFKVWHAKLYAMPSAESPVHLEAFKEERQSYKDLIGYAQLNLGDSMESLRVELIEKLKKADLIQGSPVWDRSFDFHWSNLVAEFWKLPSRP
ncbi:MAG: hypothetical protein ACO25G_04155 [Holophagaceae bacterium]